MQTEQPDEYGYGRKLHFSGLPEIAKDGTPINLRHLSVQVQYLEEDPNDGQRVEKAITLDHCVLPLLAKAPAMEVALYDIILQVKDGIANHNNHAGLLWHLKYVAEQALKEHRKP